VEDLRSTTVPDDPVQRRDLILIERARSGDLDAFNDLVKLYQDSLFALVVRMVPDRDQASDAVQEAFFSAFRNLAKFRGGSVKSWLNRICVNAAMDTQRLRKRRPVQPYPELEDESWQPKAGDEVDPEIPPGVQPATQGHLRLWLCRGDGRRRECPADVTQQFEDGAGGRRVAGDGDAQMRCRRLRAAAMQLDEADVAAQRGVVGIQRRGPGQVPAGPLRLLPHVGEGGAGQQMGPGQSPG
jgi:RNA polymerase sigma factor (sigma-70 family)